MSGFYDPISFGDDWKSGFQTRLRQEFRVGFGLGSRNAHVVVSGLTDGGPPAYPAWVEARVWEMMALRCADDTDGDGHCGKRGCRACGGPPS